MARIMVDELLVWSNKPPTPRCFWNGSCHLTTDGLIEDLHAFAARLGLKRAWFQNHKLMPHYDLTPKMREKALAMGAVYVSGMQQARERRAARKEAGNGSV